VGFRGQNGKEGRKQEANGFSMNPKKEDRDEPREGLVKKAELENQKNDPTSPQVETGGGKRGYTKSAP